MAITADKFLGKKKGGALALRPKGNIVPVKDKGSSIEKVDPENPTLVIRTKLIRIEDILKGTLAAEKKAADERKKAQEKEERDEQEKDIEDDSKSETKFKLPLPGKIKSWWENIKKFFFTVLFGWLFLKFMKWLPKLKGILKLLAGLAEFLIDWGGRILNGLVTFVSWGVKAYDWTRDKVEDIFGKKGVKVFDKISGVLSTVLNLVMSLTLAMIAVSGQFGDGLMNAGSSFLRQIFKYGLKRAGPRLLIKMFGKKTAASLLGKSVAAKTVAATTATTAGGTTAAAGGTTVGTTATGVVGVGAAATGAIVAGAGLLASGLGEGIFQLRKLGKKKEEESYKKFKEKNWLQPMKYFWGAAHLMDKFNNFQAGIIGNILDIVGTPFRYLIELIRYPFLDEAGRKKQNENMAKFDARIREHFREMVNTMSLGMLAKDKGAFGSLFGKKGTDAMGYTKDGQTKSEQLNNTKYITKTDLSGKGGSTYNGVDVYPSYEKGSTEEIVVVRRPMGRSAAKNRSEDEKDVIAVDTGTGFNVSFNSSSLYR